MELELLKNLSIVLGINLADEEDVSANGKGGYLVDSYNEIINLRDAFNYLCEKFWQSEKYEVYQNKETGKYFIEKSSVFYSEYETEYYELIK